MAIHTRLYIWSGRDGYRKAWNNQVCCKDLWFLEVEKPPAPGKVQLSRAATNMLEVNWTPVPGAEGYLLQIMKFESPKDAIPQSLNSTPTPTVSKPVPIAVPISSEAIQPQSSMPQQQALTTSSPANLPAASSLISALPANLAGTASNALFATRGRLVTPQQLPIASTGLTTATAGASPQRGIVRFRNTASPSIIKTVPSTTTASSLVGMNALAAAAAATQKIQTPQQQNSNTATVKVIQGPVVSSSPAGLKLPTQTIRILNPGNVSATTASSTASPQKIIVQQKLPTTSGVVTTPGTSQQPQLFTVLKPGSPVQQVQKVVTTGSPVGTKAGPNIIRIVGPPGAAGKVITQSPVSASTAGVASSKPATFVFRPGSPAQYVVVTQASALRNFQNANQQTRMIMVTSGGTTSTQAKPITILSSAPKTTNVVLSPKTATQYITPTGQLVTIPQGQISIGGKPVSIQVAGGQKFALMPTTSGAGKVGFQGLYK